MNRIDELVQILERLSPMPPDDSPELTAERLRSYGEIIAQIDEMTCHSEAGDTQLIEPLIRSFGYGDAHEAYWPVIHILEKYPADILRLALRKAVQIGEPGARMWCAYMLGRHRNHEDVPILVGALGDSEYRVRHNALGALAMIGDLAAKPAMETLLDDAVEEVRREAKECIEALTDRRWAAK